MADYKISRVSPTGNRSQDHDDPLMELSRMMENAQSDDQIRKVESARPVPEFDLEDELLKEFEKFDAPLKEPALSFVSADSAAHILVDAETVPVSTRDNKTAAESIDPGFASEAENQDIVFSAPDFDFADLDIDPPRGVASDSAFNELANVASDDRPVRPAAPVAASMPPSAAVSAFAEWKADRLEATPAPLEPSVPPLRSVSSGSGTRRDPPDISELLAEIERYPMQDRSQAAFMPGRSTPEPDLPEPEMPNIDEAQFVADDWSLKDNSQDVDPVDQDIGQELSNADDMMDPEIDMSSIELELTELTELTDLADESASSGEYEEDRASGWEMDASNKRDHLQFDPSQIMDAEDDLENITDLEVPNLPVMDAHAPVEQQRDFFEDIDAEMGNLFDETMDERSKSASHAIRDIDFGDTKSPSRLNVERDPYVDDFELAMEEDFRQSLMQSKSASAGMHSEPYYERSESNDIEAPVIRTPRSGSLRSAVYLAAGFAGVAIFAAGGYFVWNSTGLLPGSMSGEPRIVLADKEPMKIVPEDKGGQTVPNQDKAVYDKVAGGNTVDPKQKTLISSAEVPVDVVQKTLAPEAGATPEQAPAATDTADTQDSRLLPSAAQPADVPPAAGASTEAQPAVIAPRKVKTMIVKADGTLVERTDGAEIAKAADAAAKPAIEAPKADAEMSQQLQASTVGKNETHLTPDPAAAAPANGTSEPEPSVVAVPANKVTAKTVAKTPVPSSRPADQPVNVVGMVTANGTVVAKPEAVKAAAAATPSASGSSYGIQIASLPSEDEAKRSSASLQNKFGGVLAGRSLEIRKADLAGKGTYFRVRVAVGTKDEAAALCLKYRAAGGSCIVSK
ncbi:MAG: hypothetical protein RIR97_273 [Pseudomonadota bacterium]